MRLHYGLQPSIDGQPISELAINTYIREAVGNQGGGGGGTAVGLSHNLFVYSLSAEFSGS